MQKFWFELRFSDVVFSEQSLEENQIVPPEPTFSESPAIGRLVGGLLLILLGVSVPIVICMPLTSDTVLFDLQARVLLHGGVLYRDMLEPNLPGIVWIHLLLRSLIGWSSEAIRAADIVIVAAACSLLTRLAILDRAAQSSHDASRRVLSSKATFLFTLLFMGLFYLSRNEWCHCQRDSWMLLPVALAMTIGGKSLSSRSENCNKVWPLLEGMFWGVAFWIKPHIAVSVLTLFLFEILLSSNPRRAIGRIGIVVVGGMLAGIPGICWLVNSGTMGPFLEMQLEWNGEYLQAAWERRTAVRLWYMLIRFHPWWIVHCFAVPVAVARLGRCIQDRRLCSLEHSQNSRVRAAVLPLVYLSWLTQASILQHAMDYIQVPPVLLGISVLSAGFTALPQKIRQMVLITAVVLALLSSPLFWPQRLSMWTTCLREGSSWSVRSALALGRFPNWAHMKPVVDYLADQKVRTGDVTCYNVHSIHIYEALQIRPSTRYAGISALIELFPTQRPRILNEVARCGHRFVVTDSDESQPDSTRYPWNLPVVFRSGNFSVHRVDDTTELLSIAGVASVSR